MSDSSTSTFKTFLEHLEDFRHTLLACLSTLLIGCIIVGCFFPFFADFLNYPLNKALGQDTSTLQGLVTTSPMGIFSVLIQVCFLGGLALSLPFMIIYIAKFIAPGLTFKEKSILKPACFAILVLFLIGASFSYFFVLPASLSAAIALNKIFGFELIWSAPTYYGLVVWMTIGIGLCFEFPLGIILLMYLGTISSEKLKSIRRHMIVALLITSALITPSGDPFSLAILFFPLYALYELSIIVGRRFEPKASAEFPEESDQSLI